jgi:mRNA-degrading endonuclease RelE of RelBE toxin-antitoxin system/DNA-binding XRE family transcriptional regulator
MVEVDLTPEARRDFNDLPTRIVTRMRRLIVRLRHWPHVSGVKRLRGELSGKYRLRTGDYRLQFRVERRRVFVRVKRRSKDGAEIMETKEQEVEKVIIEKAGHRDGFYDE